METAIVNYNNVKSGATIPIREFTITQTISEVTTPVDLTNVEISASFVLCADVVEFTEGSGITVTDAANGVFQIDSFVLNKAGVWKYGVKLIFPGPVIKKWVEGNIRVLQSYTT